MSFIVKCTKCGYENEFKNGESSWSNKIEIDVDTEEDLVGVDIKSIDIFCQNDECPNWIELKL